MFSTSTNLVCQGQLASHGIAKFDQFALFVPGAVCSALTLIYMVVAVPVILHRFVKSEEEASDGDKANKGTSPRLFTVYVQVVGHVASKPLGNSELVETLAGGIGDLCHCERYGEILTKLSQDFALQLDDILCIRTTAESIVKLQQTSGIRLLTQDGSEQKASEVKELVQVVLDRQSPLVGNTLEGANRRGKYGCSTVAYRSMSVEEKAGECCVNFGSAANTMLAQGDTLIFAAPPEFYSSFRDSSDFVLLRRLSSAQKADAGLPENAAAISGGIVLVMIFCVGCQLLPLLVAVLSALFALIMTGCATLDGVMKSVKLRTVCVIVGAFGLGTAIGKEGVARVLAQLLIFILGPFGATGYLSAIFLATVALGVVFHGTAVVILMFPVCLEVANSAGLPVHQVMAVLCMAVACQLLSPISYQTNLMAYTACAYDFADFTKVGAGLVAMIAVVSIPMCQLYFPG